MSAAASEITLTFGSLLSKQRASLQYSIEDIAGYLKTSVDQISKFESGSLPIPDKYILPLISKLQLDPETVFNFLLQAKAQKIFKRLQQ